MPDEHSAMQDRARPRGTTSWQRVEEMLDLRTRQQAAVAQFGVTAMAGGDLSGLFHGAASLVAETLNIDCAHLLELRAERCFVMRAGVGWQPSARVPEIPCGRESQAGFTILAGTATMLTDAREERRFRLSPHLRERAVVSGVTVIIGTPARPFGVLGVYTRVHRVFTPQDVDFLQAVANIIAAAVTRHHSEEVRDHLLERAIVAQEEERARIARELHDETAQALSAILVGLKNLQDAARSDGVRDLAQRLRDLTAQAVNDVGRLARGLRPSILDDLGLLPALQRYGDDLAQLHQLSVQISGDPTQRYPRNIETTLYRIVQEALTNVARHAGARRAAVMIQRQNGTVHLCVQDDGGGFDVESAMERGRSGHALGILGMRERASLVGGSLTISSQPGRGTSITVELPTEDRI